MRFAFDPRQHPLNIVETSEQARAQVEAGGLKRAANRPLIEDGQAGTQGVVHNGLERPSALPHQLLEAHRDVGIQGNSGSHILMLSC